jgi:hypothetical protein
LKEQHDVIAEFSKDSLDIKVLNIKSKNYRLRLDKLRYPIYNTKQTQIVLKYNKIIIKMHKRDPQIWRELRQDAEPGHENSCLEEGCLRMIHALRQHGDEYLRKQIDLAESDARNFKY